MSMKLTGEGLGVPTPNALPLSTARHSTGWPSAARACGRLSAAVTPACR